MTATDPVCGMTINDADAVATSVHDGTTFYFCSEHCKQQFDASPATYT